MDQQGEQSILGQDSKAEKKQYGTFDADSEEPAFTENQLRRIAPMKGPPHLIATEEMSNFHEVYKLLKTFSLLSVAFSCICIGLVFGNYHLTRQNWWIYTLLGLTFCLVGSLTIFMMTINSEIYPYMLMHCAGMRHHHHLHLEAPETNREVEKHQTEEDFDDDLSSTDSTDSEDMKKHFNYFLMIMTLCIAISFVLCAMCLFKFVNHTLYHKYTAHDKYLKGLKHV